MAKSERVTIRLPTPVIGDIDALVELGEYANRTEIVRAALRMFFQEKGASAKEVIAAKQGMQELKQMAAQMQAIQAKMKGLGLLDDL